MKMREEYVAGVPCWVDVATPDPRAAMRFYSGLFGWEFEELNGYQVAKLGDGSVAGIGALVPDAPAAAPAWNSYIRVDSAAETAAKVVAAGGSVLQEPYELPGIARVAVCADPAGARFRLWEPAGLEGAHRVNEPGTWNFNELNTDDLEGATAFYGTVFGWEAAPLEFGGESVTMWRRPGYGDFLETIEPGVRARHEEGGTPPGFTDAVGWMQPLADGGQPHWSLTFSVDDPDAAAERAGALGGAVVVPPFDAGGARVTVLRDPDGAVFTASKYTG